jgi:hypothetical protein
MSSPVRFRLDFELDHTPHEIGAMILDLATWPTFPGWGPLPGIKSAAFEREIAGVAGTRIAVRTTDGSTYVEEIIEWDLPRTIRIRLAEFSPPLNKLATHFEESWRFEQGAARAVRAFELYPRRWWTRSALWLIRPMLKAAVRRHMRSLSTRGDE